MAPVHGKSRMKRRQFLTNTAAVIGTASLVRPGVVRAASASTLKFVPYADLAVLDPLGSAFVTRNHVMMVFDTLFALDANGDAQPQMLAGYTVEDGAKTWKLTLRDGLLFHDGSKVLARDVVASLRRWAVRDAFGQAVMIGIGGHLAMPPLPHHRAYGSVPRRFDWVKLGRRRGVGEDRVSRSSDCAGPVGPPGVRTCARTPSVNQRRPLH